MNTSSSTRKKNSRSKSNSNIKLISSRKVSKKIKSIYEVIVRKYKLDDNKKCINDKMLKLKSYLEKKNHLKSQEVKNVFCSIDRKIFSFNNSYDDVSSYINSGATLSAPRLHMEALELMFEKFKDKSIKGNYDLNILDIGSGSGYLSLALFKLFPGSRVTGVEHIKDLVVWSNSLIKKNFIDVFNSENFLIVKGDGRKGYAKLAPYDIIHVGASFLNKPNELLEQLKVGGRMYVPLHNKESNNVRSNDQHVHIFDKVLENGEIKIKDKIISDEPYIAMQSSKNQIKLGMENIYDPTNTKDFGEILNKDH